MAAARRTKKAESPIGGGEVFAAPVGELGYCSGVISRPPQGETGLIHVYVRMELTRQPLKAGEIGRPHEWPGAWIGLLKKKSVESGRWPVAGVVPRFDREAFPIPPVGTVEEIKRSDGTNAEVCWVETTADEPSMWPIANVAASAAEARRFPGLNVIVAGSNLEKSLVRHFGKMGFTFHDVPVEPRVVREGEVERWDARAAAARKRASEEPQAKLLPAGARTDRGAKAGDWFAFPMPGGGYGAAILIVRPAKHERVFGDAAMMSVRRRWERCPTLEDVRGLRAEDGAILRQTSMICARDGRWRGLGAHPGYDAAKWPWPERWWAPHDDAEGTSINLRFGPGDNRRARLPKGIIDLDPVAGLTLSAMSGGDGIAFDTHRVLEGIARVREPKGQWADPIVTPARIAAWKEQNAAIAAARASAVRDPLGTQA